jgi:N-hydroxyarylamine O-acetyltransferase
MTIERSLPDVSYAPISSLDAYFERIGYTGATSRSLATLNAILQAHVQSIPFENVDVLLGKGVDLAVEAIWQKLVLSPRGGYCFEHNTLLWYVLRELGFAPAVLSARVRIGRPRNYMPARTHMVLRVELDQASWLVDSGVGGLSPTTALNLETEQSQTTPHETRRIVRIGQWHGLEQRSPDATLLHQVLLGETWQDVCEFTLEEMPLIDRTIANWYLITHPQSHFRDRLMVAKANPNGRATLLNKELTQRDLAGVSRTTVIESSEQLQQVLDLEFGIRVDDVNTLWPKVP